MRICLVSPLPPPYGGISNWTLLVFRLASSKGIEIIQVDTAPRWRAVDNLSVLIRISGGSIQFIRDYYRFLKAIKKKPNIVHVTTSGSLSILQNFLVCLTARLLGLPCVYHLRFGRIPEIAKKNTLEWKLLSTTMRLSRMVIGVTPQTIQAIKKHLPHVSVQYIPNPINLSDLPVPSLSRISKKRVFFLGWILPTKGINELVQAWSELELENWDLLIAGPGNTDYQKKLLDIHKPKHLRFLGELSHDIALQKIAESDIFILPSYTEGFPNVILEAMALGKPIIATSVGAIPEMLSGDCGLLIQPRNVDAIASALQLLISNDSLRERLGRNALEKVICEYEANAVFTQYIKTWQELSSRN